MKNVNQLEKQRKEVLSNMKPDEIRKIYENLSNEYVSYLWSYKNNFERNEEGIQDIIKKFMDLEIDLKHRYRTDFLVSNTMMFSLLEDHDENTIEIMNLKNIILFLELNTFYSLLKTNLCSLKYNLYQLYVRYRFRYGLISFYKIEEYIKDKFKLDIDKEEDLKLIMELDEGIHELSIGFYDEIFSRKLREYNFIIKILVDTIDMLINQMNPYLEHTPNITEDTIEGLVPMLKNYKELQEEIKERIREYEELKLNPFIEVIESTVESEVKRENEFNEKYNEEIHDPKNSFPMVDYDERLKAAIETAPKYDFEEFELIVPEEEGVETDEV